MAKTGRLLKASTSATLSLALVLLSPGLECYAGGNAALNTPVSDAGLPTTGKTGNTSVSLIQLNAGSIQLSPTTLIGAFHVTPGAPSVKEDIQAAPELTGILPETQHAAPTALAADEGLKVSQEVAQVVLPAGTLGFSASNQSQILAGFKTPSQAVSSQPGEKTAQFGADADLARLFDGAKGYSADSISVSLVRADGRPVTMSLAELSQTLKADASLAKSLNEGGKVELMLKSQVGAKVPKSMAEDLTGYLRQRGISAPVSFAHQRSRWVGLDFSLLKNAPKLLRESWTVPNRQDYAYLATKTFGLNLAIRLFFTIGAVNKGDLPLLRAVASTTWYQLQDAAFTLFGQTYMKFIGRMTGLLRIGRGYFGDFLFTYMQLTAFEFLNRLVLGPIGENPLVYTWGGLGLIFANVFMGMISGGPLIPAINKMRRAGVISQSTMMHLYQLASLTMQFGLIASFGCQHLYFLITLATFLLAWGSYAFFTLFYKDKPGIDTGLGAEKPAGAPSEKKAA